MMDEPLTPEEIKRRLEQSGDHLSQLGEIINQAAAQFVLPLASFFDVIGVRHVIPPEWIIYAVMQYTEMQFSDISREDWIRIYDQSREIRKITKENPEIVEQYAAKQEPTQFKSALDIVLAEEFGLDFD
jgi:hypothetical protein